jgi:hypothetical protein
MSLLGIRWAVIFFVLLIGVCCPAQAQITFQLVNYQGVEDMSEQYQKTGNFPFVGDSPTPGPSSYSNSLTLTDEDLTASTAMSDQVTSSADQNSLSFVCSASFSASLIPWGLYGADIYSATPNWKLNGQVNLSSPTSMRYAVSVSVTNNLAPYPYWQGRAGTSLGVSGTYTGILSSGNSDFEATTYGTDLMGENGTYPGYPPPPNTAPYYYSIYSSVSVQATFQVLPNNGNPVAPGGPGEPGGTQPTSGNAIWAQAQSGNWSTEINWMENVLPASGIDTFFDTGSSTPYTVNLTGASAAKSLTLQGDNVTLAIGGNTLSVGGTVTVDGFGGQTGSLTVEGPGTLSAGGGVTVTSAGKLGGSATIVGNVTNSGILQPDATNSFAINGNYTQMPSGALNVLINGTPASGSYGSVTVGGAAALAGNLNVTLGNNQGADFLPSNSDTYTAVLSGQPTTGTFANSANGLIAAKFTSNSNSANNNSAGLFSITYNNNSVTLSNFHQVDYLGIGVNFPNIPAIPPSTEPVSTLRMGGQDVLNMENALFDQFAIPITLDATNSVAYNNTMIQNGLQTFSEHFNNGVGANDTIIIELASHGTLSADGTTEEFQISGNTNGTGTNNGFISATDLADQFAAVLPASAQKIILVDCCDSGAFIDALQASGLENYGVLTSDTAEPGMPMLSYSAPDGTGLFSDGIEKELNNGVYNLAQIAATLNSPGFDSDLDGQTLNLEDNGSSVFNGLSASSFESSGFNADLVGASILSVPEPASDAVLICAATILLWRRRRISRADLSS